MADQNRFKSEKEAYWQLSVVFTSVLLAVVVSLSFERHILHEPLSSLTPAYWFLLYTYLIIIWSQIGYLRSIASTPYQTPYRFFPDFAILFIYGYLTWNITNYWTITLAIFGLLFIYFGWDVLKLREVNNPPLSFTRFRAFITVIFVFISGSIAIIPVVIDLFGYSSGTLHWIFPSMELLLIGLFWVAKSEILKSHMKLIHKAYWKNELTTVELFHELATVNPDIDP